MMSQPDPSLTKFQWKVLAVAAGIPLGETRSYEWVAKQAGSPKAARAVGQALRRNPYPLIIPCHRVIKKDGSSGGYAGKQGKRKMELLAIEQAVKRKIALIRDQASHPSSPQTPDFNPASKTKN